LVSDSHNKILNRFGDNCITNVGMCCGKDGCYRRQAFTEVNRKTSLPQGIVFRTSGLGI